MIENKLVKVHSTVPLPSGIEQCLKSIKTSITSGDWKKFKMNLYHDLIDEWLGDTIRFQNNDESTIIKEISEWKFPNLTWIDLGGNSISSFEGIHRIHLPNLKQLWVNNKYQNQTNKNYISNINEFRKVYWPHFHLVSFSGNLIWEGSALAKMNYEPGEIWLDWSYEHEKCFDVSWIFKFNKENFQLFGMNSKERISQRSIVECLKRKYPEITVYVK